MALCPLQHSTISRESHDTRKEQPCKVPRLARPQAANTAFGRSTAWAASARLEAAPAGGGGGREGRGELVRAGHAQALGRGGRVHVEPARQAGLRARRIHRLLHGVV